MFVTVLVPCRRCVGASGSGGAAPRRRLVGRVFPAARAAQPSEHEDVLWFALSRKCFFSFSQFLEHAQYCRELYCSRPERKVFLFNAFLLCFSLFFVSANVAFSLSLPRIWLSRSTSKIDALDDGETPLPLTAS